MGDVEQTPTAARKGSAAPTTDETPTSIGGVAVDMSGMSLDNSSASQANGTIAWQGPKQEAGRTADERNPFGGSAEAAQVMSPTSMNATATAFQPSVAQTVQATEPDYPTIVSSTKPKSKSKGKQRSRSPSPDGRFTTDPGQNGCHFLKVANVTDHTGNMGTLLDQYQNALVSFGDLGPIHVPEANGTSTYFLVFDDWREAGRCYDTARELGNGQWEVVYVSDTVFQQRTGFSGKGTTKFDGQVIFSVWLNDGRFDVIDAHLLEGMKYTAGQEIRALAGTFGPVNAITNVSKTETPRIQEYRVEYCCFSTAWYAVAQLAANQSRSLTCGRVIAKPMGYRDMVTPTTPPRTTIVDGQKIHISPTGRSAWTYDSNGNEVVCRPLHTVPKVDLRATSNDMSEMPHDTPGRGRFSSEPNPMTPHPSHWDELLPHMMAKTRSTPNHRSAHSRQGLDDSQQTVSIDRIRDGYDVRTTVMLRNIPNTWTCHEIKAILDSTSFGMYDFSYLRIDFEKGCNVGYAFVNFIEAAAIVPFMSKYMGLDWETGLPDGKRKSQMSYATIQGHDCLIEKFRNSAVMAECTDFRPKLWWTYKDVGEVDESAVCREKKFPPPNNNTKKQRSHDNAGHLGLFAPRSGQRNVDRQRRSNYDRGTTRQMQEDYNYQVAPAGVPGGFGYVDPSRIPIGTPGGYGSAAYGSAGAVVPYGYAGQAPGYGPPAVMPYNAAPYPGTYGGGPYGGPPFPGPGGFMAPGHGGPVQAAHNYRTVNPASNLRTISQGRLAGRPQNVTQAPEHRYDPLPDPHTGRIPRTFVNQSPSGPANGGNNQYGGHGYPVTNGYAAGNTGGNAAGPYAYY